MPYSSTTKVHPISRSPRKPDPSSQKQQADTPAQQPPTSVHPVEPEDKKATGNSQRQQRKVLEMNVGKDRQAQQHPATPAGQHATGSFPTGTEEKNRKR
jgi:hypothetical protein